MNTKDSLLDSIEYGYAKYRNHWYSYHFNIETYTVDLTLANVDCDKYISSVEFKEEFFSKEGYAKKIPLFAIPHSRTFPICFNISDINPADFEPPTFISFRVDWVFVSNLNTRWTKFRKLKITGGILDKIVPSLDIVDREIHTEKGICQDACIKVPGLVKTFNRTVNDTKKQYELSLLKGWTIRESSNSIFSLVTCSGMEFTFEKDIPLKESVAFYYEVRRTLEFFAYTRDINIGNIALYNEDDEDGNPVIAGHLLQTISDSKPKKVLNVNLFKEKLGNLFIDEGLFDHTFFCSNENERPHYDNRRLIFIFTAFENAYDVAYVMKDRSPKYYAVKKEITDFINLRKDKEKSKDKKYWKEFAKCLNMRDKGMSFQDKLVNALENFRNINNALFGCSFNEFIDKDDGLKSLARSVSICRNNLAHSKMEDVLAPNLIEKAKIIEKLIFCIKLRYYEISDEDITIALNDIF